MWCLSAQPYPLPRHGLPSSPVTLASLQQLPQGHPVPLSSWCILQPSQLPAPLQPWTACTLSFRLWIGTSLPRMRAIAASYGPAGPF